MKSLIYKSRAVYCLVLLGCSLSLWSCRASKKIERACPTALVTNSSVTFWFPIADPNKQWQWGISRDSLLEYAWQAQVNLMGEQYEIGYSNFKHPDSMRKVGNLEALLFDGQVNVWRLKKERPGGTFVEGIFASSFWRKGIAAYRQAGGVTIGLTDPNFVSAFVSEKPKQVIMRTDGTMLTETKHTVDITYDLTGND